MAQRISTRSTGTNLMSDLRLAAVEQDERAQLLRTYQTLSAYFFALVKRSPLSLIDLGFLKIVKRPQDPHAPITDEDTRIGNIIPLVPNRPQRRLLNIVQEKWRNNEPIRIVVVKARQHGISTIIQAIIFCVAIVTTGFQSTIISHMRQSTNRVFRMFQRFYRNLPDELAPKVDRSSAEIIRFHDAEKGVTDSVVEVETAREREGICISGSYHAVHCSEFAYWPDQAVFDSTVLPAVHKSGRSMIFIESTGNGWGDFFCAFFRGVMKGAIKGWVAFFSPWYESDEYELRLTPEESSAFLQTLSPDEQTLREQIAAFFAEHWQKTLSNVKMAGKLAWHRQELESARAKGTEQRFREQYPSTWQEAFQYSGSSAFTADHLNAQRPNVRPPIWRGFLAQNEDGTPALKDGQLQFLEDPNGDMSVWEWPKTTGTPSDPPFTYAAGCDSAGGAKQALGRDPDYNVLTILNRDTGLVSLTIRNRMEPDLFGHQVLALCTHYGECWVSGDVTGGYGTATLNVLLRANYPRLCARPVYNRVLKQHTMIVGFKIVNRDTVVNLIVGTLAALRTGELVLNDGELLEEMETFVKHEDGHYAAQPGGHDDRVFSLMIAQWVRGEFPAEGTVEIRKTLIERFEAGEFDETDTTTLGGAGESMFAALTGG